MCQKALVDTRGNGDDGDVVITKGGAGITGRSKRIIGRLSDWY